MQKWGQKRGMQTWDFIYWILGKWNSYVKIGKTLWFGQKSWEKLKGPNGPIPKLIDAISVNYSFGFSIVSIIVEDVVQ